MKLLESSRFEALNSALHFDAGQYQIIGRYDSIYCHFCSKALQLYLWLDQMRGKIQSQFILILNQTLESQTEGIKFKSIVNRLLNFQTQH